MCENKFVKLLFFISIVSVALSRPASSDYYRQGYEVGERKFTAFYNRLPPNVQVDEPQANDDYDYEDQQTDRPVQNNQYQSGSYQSGSYPLLTENKIKRKKRKRLCIPVQSIGSPLFSNRVKRNYMEKNEQGKTFGFLLGGNNGGGYPYYGGINPYVGGLNPYAGNYPHLASPAFGQYPQRPLQSPVSQLGSPVYNAHSGYPCIPVSTGHIPHQGPFGFLGAGGLFDTGGSSGVNYPQTVIINRPPLFGNRPSYSGNRPQGVAADSDGTRPGFFGSVVDKLTEFVIITNNDLN